MMNADSVDRFCPIHEALQLNGRTTTSLTIMGTHTSSAFSFSRWSHRPVVVVQKCFIGPLPVFGTAGAGAGAGSGSDLSLSSVVP